MDAASLLNDLRSALGAELGAGYSTISGLIESQGRLLSDQAIFIAQQRADGALRDNDALYAHFVAGLEANSRNLSSTVAMLTALTIEKAWNAVANVLWGGMNLILAGAGIPPMLIPQAPPHI